MTALVRACKERGLLPFVNYNRLHVVSTCTIWEQEAKEGLAMLDEALAVADGYLDACARLPGCGLLRPAC